MPLNDRDEIEQCMSGEISEQKFRAKSWMELNERMKSFDREGCQGQAPAFTIDASWFPSKSAPQHSPAEAALQSDADSMVHPLRVHQPSTTCGTADCTIPSATPVFSATQQKRKKPRGTFRKMLHYDTPAHTGKAAESTLTLRSIAKGSRAITPQHRTKPHLEP